MNSTINHLSMEPSHTFQTTNSWLEPTSPHPCYNGPPRASAPSPPITKLRLMCSFGGHIVPRPHDKSLCYVGGETRMVAVDRHISLQDLINRLSKTLLRSPLSSTTTPPPSFTLKYQLPSEDLDSLISVTTDEDLENMIDEYERINLNKNMNMNSSSRLRLFIFSTNRESGTFTSIGSFLENPVKSEDWFLNALNGTKSGCSDTSSVNCLLDLDDHEEKKDVSHKVVVGQDVHSVSDSLMMETTSSFGSASSTPSNGNLLPVRVDVRDPVAVLGSPVSSAKAVQERSDPFSSYHQQQQEKQSTGLDLASMDSILSDLTIPDQSSPVSQIQSSCSNNQLTDPTIQMPQQQKVNNSAYYHQLHHQQPQFIPPQQYIHHHPSTSVPVSSYYHHAPMNQQNVMYYIPTSQPPYNFPFHQTQHADTRSVHATPNNQAAAKTELYRTTSSGAPQLVRLPSGYYATPLLTGQYQQMTSVSHVEAGMQEHNR